MFIALILGVLGVLLSQEQMAAALPLPVTVDCQAPPPGPLSLASHSAAPVCHHVRARGGTGLSPLPNLYSVFTRFPIDGPVLFQNPVQVSTLHWTVLPAWSPLGCDRSLFPCYSWSWEFWGVFQSIPEFICPFSYTEAGVMGLGKTVQRQTALHFSSH